MILSRGGAHAAEALPTPPYALALSRRIWNLRAAAERGEAVDAELAAAIAERNAYRCRDV
jgi:hypothetical protein